MGLDTCLASGVWRFEFCVFLFFFFSFFFFWHAFKETNCYCSWTVAVLFDFSTLFQHISGSRPVNNAWDPQILLFNNFFLLKMGFMVLFIYLKIILLQYFQFLISAKISCIQTELLKQKQIVYLTLKIITSQRKSNT